MALVKFQQAWYSAVLETSVPSLPRLFAQRELLGSVGDEGDAGGGFDAAAIAATSPISISVFAGKDLPAEQRRSRLP